MTAVEEARAKLAPAELEIGSTTLSPRQMDGFHVGYALAAEGGRELTQGTVDLICDLLEVEGADDFQLGRLVGFLRYHEELLRLMAEEAEYDELLMAIGPEDVH
jgi:hypothetical protein